MADRYACALLFLTILNLSHAYLRYIIGTPGIPWGTKEKQEWFNSRVYYRSYQEEVVKPLIMGFEGFTVHQYGTLHVNKNYPLYVVKSKNWDDKKPCVLITGGVHGYETSGVQGAILFLQRAGNYFSQTFNIAVAPCINPWGYETMERWNAQAMDPNRSFGSTAATNESRALKQYLQQHFSCAKWLCHLDLHETNDFDKFEFRPAQLARDGEISNEVGTILDGFYLVTDSTISNPQCGWLKAMLDSVRKVTHIAPIRSSDTLRFQQLCTGLDGTVIGEDALHGVMPVPVPALGMCMGITNAKYKATTEIYPDSPSVTAQLCNQAQMMSILGGLEYIMQYDKEILLPSHTIQTSFA